MFGKHHASMYTGSMVGAGFGAYAVMGYVISNQKPERMVRGPAPEGARGKFYVTLNPVVLAAIFGETVEAVQKAMDYLCAPDPESTTPTEEGRRLVKTGQFTYWVVNGAMYDAIRNEEDRREQNRLAQARWREEQRRRKKMTPEERKEYEAAHRKEYRKRRKKIIHEGACAGAQEAIQKGLDDAEQAKVPGPNIFHGDPPGSCGAIGAGLPPTDVGHDSSASQ